MATDRYVLLEQVGTGGMAEVFRATARGAEGFERPVAIKRILRHLAADEEFIRMFVDEAKIAVQLQHPNIVQVFDLGRDGSEYFIAMEYVHGKDLRAIQQRLARAEERVPLAVALHVAMKVCEALHHAHLATGPNGHSLGVVHRDVTPQNVLVSYDGEVKVADFGLAKAAGRALETQAGMVKGKLAYIAPEAYAGISIDHRADVYGVGILLWEMIAGRALFAGASDGETIERARLAMVPPLRSIDSSVPLEIERVVQTALTRDRERRYASADALREDLETFAYERQQFMTSSSLASWLREWFPLESPASAPIASVGRRRDVATRELAVGGAPRGAERAPTSSMVEELDIDELVDVDDRGDTVPPPTLESSEGATAPLPPANLADTLDEGARFDPTAIELQSASLVSPSDAGKTITERHYDADLLHQTIDHAPAEASLIEPPPVPLGELSWDEDEDRTDVALHGPKRQ